MPTRPTKQKSRAPLWVVLLGLLLLVAAVGGILLVTRDDDPPGSATGGAPVRLQGVASYDPDGDDEEHSERVADATDGDPATYWTTESYRGAFSKPGVGLVLKVAGAPQRLTLTTDTPGFNAEIRAGSSPGGPFDAVVAGDARTAATTTWELGDTDAPYLVVWITDLDGVAHLNEVTASS